ncbi:MAG: RluA family pseudouridine synthase [Pseudomonadota bacterium]
MPAHILKTIIIPQELDLTRLDKALTTLCPELTRTRIKNLILEGHVSTKNQPTLDPAKKVHTDQTIHLEIPEVEEGVLEPQDIPLNIVYEDADIIIINKPAGMVVHPAPGNPDNTLVNALLFHCGQELSGIGGIRRPGIVHRLDKETSGLLVVAKNDNAHQNLSEQLANRSLGREYEALVWGIPKPLAGVIEGNIGRHPRSRQKMTVLPHSGKPARTHYAVKQIFGMHAARVKCKLETGRTHQIRVHMASIGHSVIGDQVYGRLPRTAPLELKRVAAEFGSTKNRHALHAAELHLMHPIQNNEMHFQAKSPADMTKLISLLEEFTS